MLGRHDQARKCNDTVSLSMAVQSYLLPVQTLHIWQGENSWNKIQNVTTMSNRFVALIMLFELTLT